MNSTLAKTYHRVVESLENLTFRRIVIVIFRLVVGFVLLRDGFLIVNDPYGSGIVAEGIISELGLRLLMPLSLVLAFIVGSFKVSVGCCLLMGTNVGVAAMNLIIYLFIEFFVLVKLDSPTSWLIARNVAFILLGALIFYWRKHSVKIYTKRTEWVIELYSFAFSVLFAAHCYISLPMLDTTAAKEGNSMKSAFLTEAKALGMDTAKVGRELECLADTGYSFVLLSRHLPDASTMRKDEINTLYEYSVEHGYPFVCLIGEKVTEDEMREYIIESKCAEYPIVKFEKSIIECVARSNPELLIMKDGTITRKFSAYKIPKLEDALDEELYGHQSESSTGRTILFSVIAYLLPLVVLLAYDYLIELLKWLIKKIVMKSKKS